MKTVLLFLACLLLSAPAVAADPKPDPLAVEYLVLSGGQATFDASLASYADQIAFLNPSVGKEEIMNYLKAAVDWETLKGPAAGIVDATFSPDELKALNAFLKTPAGQAYARKSRQLSLELTTLVRKSIEKAVTDHNENSAPPAPH